MIMQEQTQGNQVSAKSERSSHKVAVVIHTEMSLQNKKVGTIGDKWLLITVTWLW